jgi:hypothetical protein
MVYIKTAYMYYITQMISDQFLSKFKTVIYKEVMQSAMSMYGWNVLNPVPWSLLVDSHLPTGLLLYKIAKVGSRITGAKWGSVLIGKCQCYMQNFVDFRRICED